jgi:hypothetical protein
MPECATTPKFRGLHGTGHKGLAWKHVKRFAVAKNALAEAEGMQLK